MICFQYVKEAKKYEWLKTLVHLPYLKDSPACPFLKDFYYDGVGLSPPKNQEGMKRDWYNFV